MRTPPPPILSLIKLHLDQEFEEEPLCKQRDGRTTSVAAALCFLPSSSLLLRYSDDDFLVENRGVALFLAQLLSLSSEPNYFCLSL